MQVQIIIIKKREDKVIKMSNNKNRGRGGSVVVAAGSVWESRMKSDEVRGGIKVFNNAEEEEEGGVARLKRSSIGVAASGAKRKTWKNSEEKQCDGGRIKKTTIQTRKVERTNITQTRKLRSGKGAAEVEGQLRKTKSESDSVKKNNSDSGSGSGSGSGSAADLIQLRKTKSDSDSVSDESKNVIDGSDSTICEKEVEDGNLKNNDSVENCKDSELFQEKVISSSTDNVNVNVIDDDEANEGGEEDEEKEEMDEEVKIEMENVMKEVSIPESNSKIANEPEKNIKMENESCVVKEISIPESDSKIAKEPENKKIVVGNEAEKVVVVSEAENKKVVIDEPVKKKKNVNESEPKKIVSAHMRFHHRNEKPVSVPIAVKQSASIRRHSTIYQNFTKPNTIPMAEEYCSFPQSQNKMQSLVDLIMWRDVSRSAFVFGLGAFVIISSSYAKDINVSVVSVMSYIGLVYLAVIFLYRSIVCRGIIDVEDSNYVLGEEEAVWVLKLVLPYLNEFLSKLKALFSGDPGTTIKLAVLLFVLARCGSCITVWKMAKVAFFGVFTVPKICSSYSAQLSAYANFWICRFRDAWDSCSHKKAVALGVFGLVWNLSSVVARIWAVFVLFVAFRYYQQHYLVREECMNDDVAECNETLQEPVPGEVGIGQKKGRVICFVDNKKVNKGF